MLNDNKNCIFIGLPSSGKSSFIGALWHVVESGEIDSIFTVTIQPKDREYLNELRSKFLKCEAPERTKTEFVKQIELQIQEKETGNSINFLFPDLSGETYETQFELRQVTNDYLYQLKACNSCIVFINPDHLKTSTLISELDGSLFDDEDDNVGVMEQGNGFPDSQAKNLTPEKPWTPRMCQTQVKLVDLLQIIQEKLPQTCKIGIIISAWDVIINMSDENKNDTPDLWLRKNLPLFHQYLTANKHNFPYSVYGISAQGGVYSKSSNVELQKHINPSERIIVQSGNNRSHDITAPLKWLFE